MNIFKSVPNNISEKLSGLTKDFYIALLISLMIHLFFLSYTLFIASNSPTNKESIVVDFAMIQIGENLNGTTIRGESRKLKNKRDSKPDGTVSNDKSRELRAERKGRKNIFETEGTKTNSNETTNINDVAESKRFTKNYPEKSLDNMRAEDVVSLNAFTSDQHSSGNGNDSGGSYEKDKTGKDNQNASGGMNGNGIGFHIRAGEGGGKGYDYGYIRETVLKKLKYPEKARRFGWEGKVILYFVINETGSVSDVKIIKSSGIHILDEAAKDALSKVTLFHNKYKRMVVVQLPIDFRLKTQ